jgi:enoyl-CoA hydratase/carnithine racemase
MELVVKWRDRHPAGMTKALIWDSARRGQVGARLDAETAAFLERIGQPDTLRGMSRFLEHMGGTEDV